MDTLTLAYGLIAIGLVLMVAELFIPAGGVFFALGIGACIIGVALSFQYGLPTGVITLLVVLVVVPLAASALARLWPKTPMGRRLFLAGPDDEDVANMPAQLDLERLRGRYGRAVSALRPCGIVDFDGKRVDTMTNGEMIDPHHWVRCVDIKAGRVIVRQVEAPPDLGLMDTEVFDNPPT
jgi:membrane-bound serine protease (ClpP class)